jgi:hypothetical protein
MKLKYLKEDIDLSKAEAESTAQGYVDTAVENLFGDNILIQNPSIDPPVEEQTIKQFVEAGDLDTLGAADANTDEKIEGLTGLDIKTTDDEKSPTIASDISALQSKDGTTIKIGPGTGADGSIKKYVDDNIPPEPTTLYGTTIIMDPAFDPEVSIKEFVTTDLTGGNLPIGGIPYESGSIREYIDSKTPEPTEKQYLTTMDYSATDTTKSNVYVDTQIVKAVQGFPIKNYEFYNIGQLATRDPMSMAFDAEGSCFTTEVSLWGSKGNNNRWLINLYHRYITLHQILAIFKRINKPLNTSSTDVIELPYVHFYELLPQSGKVHDMGIQLTYGPFDENAVLHINFTFDMGEEGNQTFTYTAQDQAYYNNYNIANDYVAFVNDGHKSRYPITLYKFGYKDLKDFLDIDEQSAYMLCRFMFEHILYRQITEYQQGEPA